MECIHEGCGKDADYPHDECYRHRVLSVGFALKGPATQGDFHRTARDYREEQFGTNDERELEKRGIVPAKDYGW